MPIGSGPGLCVSSNDGERVRAYPDAGNCSGAKPPATNPWQLIENTNQSIVREKLRV
jgi:hypothetical protein